MSGKKGLRKKVNTTSIVKTNTKQSNTPNRRSSRKAKAKAKSKAVDTAKEVDTTQDDDDSTSKQDTPKKKAKNESNKEKKRNLSQSKSSDIKMDEDEDILEPPPKKVKRRHWDTDNNRLIGFLYSTPIRLNIAESAQLFDVLSKHDLNYNEVTNMSKEIFYSFIGNTISNKNKFKLSDDARRVFCDGMEEFHNGWSQSKENASINKGDIIDIEGDNNNNNNQDNDDNKQSEDEDDDEVE